MQAKARCGTVVKCDPWPGQQWIEHNKARLERAIEEHERACQACRRIQLARDASKAARR